jgi:predicted nucleotide-binding protein
VKLAQRQAIIRALEDFFLPLSYSEAQAILTTARAVYLLGTNWTKFDDATKRSHLKDILSRESDDVLIGLAEFLPEDKQISVAAKLPANSRSTAEPDHATDGQIFVVHGHAPGVLHETVRVLERGTGREILVLREQAHAGRTILEQFEEHAAHTSYAVVLLTGDDEGGIRASNNMNPRGRQNVIFELGFFFGKLGRRRVAVLLEENVEKPSDIDGIIYINLDQAGAWKRALARELEAANIPVNYSRIP